MIFFRTICFMLFAIPCVSFHLEAMQEAQAQDIRSIHDIPVHYAEFAESFVNGSRKCTIHYKRDLLGHFHKVYLSELENHQDGEINQILMANAQRVYNDSWLFRYEPGDNQYISLHSYDFLNAYDSAEIAKLIQNKIDQMHTQTYLLSDDQETELREIATCFLNMAESEHYIEEINEAIKGLTYFRKTRCSQQELEYIYGKIIGELRKNWQKHDTWDCKGRNYDTRKWILITKKVQPLDPLTANDQTDLIYGLARRFEFDETLGEGNRFNGEDISISIMVKKDGWDKFQSFFDLEVQ